MRSALWLLLFIVFLSAACAAAPSPTPTPGVEGISIVDPPIEVEDFSLTGEDGQLTKLSDLKGKHILIAFGYTHCPDVCPVTLARFKQIKAGLGDKAARVNFVFISVDGRRDTAERLREYLGLFDSDFIGLTGDEAAAREVISRYGGRFEINDAGGLRTEYTVDHTASNFLMDPTGRWVRTYAFNTKPTLIVDDILSLVGA